MQRREFIKFVLAAAAQSLTDRLAAQPSVRRIGVLLGGAEHDLDWRRLEAAFAQELRALGWAPGRDLRIDYRWPGDDLDRIYAHAIEIVELGPEIIVTATIHGVRAVRRRSEKIPLVFVNVADPVGSGLIADPARPGGNVTGFCGLDHTICNTWIEIIKSVAPRAVRLGFVFNPNTAPEIGGFLDPLIAVAQQSRLKPSSLLVRTEGEAERAIQEFARAPNGALLALPESSTVFHRTSIIEAANQHKLPTLFPFRFCATGGGLVSYGLDMVAQCRGAASYADKILRGTPAGDLAVRKAEKFELVINQRTAKTLGITMPAALLARADEIIE